MSQEKEWTDKLVGKTYKEGDVSAQSSNEFTKKDLPDFHRVCKPGGMFTMDFNTERLNVHVDKDNKCTKVNYG